MRKHLLILCSLMLLIAAGCSSTPDAGQESLAEGPSEPSMPLEEVYDLASQWLPNHAELVIVGVDPRLSYIDERLLPTSNPHAEPGSPGTQEALVAEMHEAMIEVSGYDPGEIYAWALAVVGFETGALVAFGDYDEFHPPMGSLRHEVQDWEVFQLNADEYDATANGDLFDSIYMMAFDEPRQGFVFTPTLEEMERLIVGESADGEGELLVHSEWDGTYRRLFREQEGRLVSAAALMGQYAAVMETDEPMPDTVVMSYGGGLKMSFEGSPEVLDGVQEMVEGGISYIQEIVHEKYHNEDAEPSEILSNIYAYHAVESVAGQLLQPQLESGRLDYEVVFTDTSWMYLGIMAVTTGWVVVSDMVMSYLGLGDDYDWDDYGYDWEDQRDERDEDYEPLTGSEDAEGEALWRLQQVADSAANSMTYSVECLDDPECMEQMELLGLSLEEDSLTFPGGTNIAVATHSEVPPPASPVVPDPVLLADSSELKEEMTPTIFWMSIGISPTLETTTRIIYETGPGDGKEATATITVEWADEDTGEVYQATRTLRVDANNEVVIEESD